jgi:REP element-mobilizing transposase RayT
MNYQNLNHTAWSCKYHIVFIPKHRKKVIFRQPRQRLGEILHHLARQEQCENIKGHLLAWFNHEISQSCLLQCLKSQSLFPSLKICRTTCSRTLLDNQPSVVIVVTMLHFPNSLQRRLRRKQKLLS